jgi:hypothetical protein
MEVFVSEKTKIYLFNNSDESGIRNQWCVCYAMAETGEVLAEHICSHPLFMEGDLIKNRPERQKAWSEKFPNGYETIIIEAENLPKEVYERNQKLRDKAEAYTEKAGVTLTFDDGREVSSYEQ